MVDKKTNIETVIGLVYNVRSTNGEKVLDTNGGGLFSFVKEPNKPFHNLEASKPVDRRLVRCSRAYFTYPTDPFTNLKPKNPSNDVPKIRKILRSPDFEALKFGKARRGEYMNRGQALVKPRP